MSCRAQQPTGYSPRGKCSVGEGGHKVLNHSDRLLSHRVVVGWGRCRERLVAGARLHRYDKVIISVPIGLVFKFDNGDAGLAIVVVDHVQGLDVRVL